MALFKGERDMSLFKRINYELVQDIVDTEIDYYKLALSETKRNLYDESLNKTYYRPVKVPSIINLGDQNYNENNTGQQDFTQTSDFFLLRDMMVERSLVPEVGDIIGWDNGYWEIDQIIESNYFGNSNPDTAHTGDDHGYNVNFRCSTHLSDKSRLNLVEVRSGINSNDFEMPSDI